MLDKTYIAIDLKSFYASVECQELGKDPLTTNLVVADKSRTDKTICLAVSPSLKAHGIPGRARLFEVVLLKRPAWQIQKESCRRSRKRLSANSCMCLNLDWKQIRQSRSPTLFTTAAKPAVPIVPLQGPQRKWTSILAFWKWAMGSQFPLTISWVWSNHYLKRGIRQGHLQANASISFGVFLLGHWLLSFDRILLSIETRCPSW